MTIATALLHWRAKNELVLFMMLVVGKELFLLVHKLIVLLWADLGVANSPHVQNFTIRLEILHEQESVSRY